jgi:hypothetical protein
MHWFCFPEVWNKGKWLCLSSARSDLLGHEDTCKTQCCTICLASTMCDFLMHYAPWENREISADAMRFMEYFVHMKINRFCDRHKVPR